MFGTGAALALAAFSVPAHAISFTGTFNITSDAATDPALVIVTNRALGTDSAPINFNLTNVGDTATFNSLFQIGTPEVALNGDDFAHKAISVAFNFTAPPPPFGGPVTGETHGSWFLVPYGAVEWDNGIQVAFGNGGLLGIELYDAYFGFANNNGVQYANVKAKFKLLQAPELNEGGITPLPAALPMFAAGLGLVGGLGYRRRRKAKGAA